MRSSASNGLGAVGEKAGNPRVRDGVEVELGVGQEAIDLLCGVLGHKSANAGQAGPDSGNGQGCGMEDAGRGISDREDPLFMHSRKRIMNKGRHAGKWQADFRFHESEIITIS